VQGTTNPPAATRIIIDVGSLATPTYVGSYYYGPMSTAHNLYVRGDYLFAANYTSGLRILDIGEFVGGGEIDDIVEVGFFDTHPEDTDPGFRGAWNNYPFFSSGNVIISDINRGLFVVKPRGLEPPVSSYPDPSAVTARADVYPNPFSDRFTVDLRIAREQHVRIEAFDVLGRRVALLFEGVVAGGANQEISLRLADQPGGIYIIRISGDDFSLTERVTRLR
jgi:hypothetical protein